MKGKCSNKDGQKGKGDTQSGSLRKEKKEKKGLVE